MMSKSLKLLRQLDNSDTQIDVAIIIEFTFQQLSAFRVATLLHVY